MDGRSSGRFSSARGLHRPVLCASGFLLCTARYVQHYGLTNMRWWWGSQFCRARGTAPYMTICCRASIKRCAPFPYYEPVGSHWREFSTGRV
eukprot:1712482-Pyramimonas_sp.AAC.1